VLAGGVGFGTGEVYRCTLRWYVAAEAIIYGFTEEDEVNEYWHTMRMHVEERVNVCTDTL
jgi:hypothetical protein